MAEDKKSLCKVETDAGNFFLLTTLHDNGEEGFDLALSDGERAWTGTGNNYSTYLEIFRNYI